MHDRHQVFTLFKFMKFEGNSKNNCEVDQEKGRDSRLLSKFMQQY